MVTETPEGLFYQVTDERSEVARCETPFTSSQFGYLIRKGEQRLLNTVNFIMDEMKLKGVEEEFLIHKFLGQPLSICTVTKIGQHCWPISFLVYWFALTVSNHILPY